MNPVSKQKKLTTIGIGILAVLAISLFLCWASTQPQALESVKDITITVTHSENFVQVAEISDNEDNAGETGPFVLEFETTAKTLGQAVEGRNVLEFALDGDQTVVAAADGEYANYYYNQYWLCYFDGERLEEPLDTYPIEDGDSFYFYLITE